MPVIRVDDDVWRELQLRVDQSNVFKENPNRVLRKLLKIDTADTQGRGTTLFELLQLYLAESSRTQKKHILDEIRRRFTVFGWMLNQGGTK